MGKVVAFDVVGVLVKLVGRKIVVLGNVAVVEGKLAGPDVARVQVANDNYWLPKGMEKSQKQLARRRPALDVSYRCNILELLGAVGEGEEGQMR